MASINSEASKSLKALLQQLEQHLNADGLAIVGPIRGGLEGLTRLALGRSRTSGRSCSWCCTRVVV